MWPDLRYLGYGRLSTETDAVRPGIDTMNAYGNASVTAKREANSKVVKMRVRSAQARAKDANYVGQSSRRFGKRYCLRYLKLAFC
jgi:hypothetical protein